MAHAHTASEAEHVEERLTELDVYPPLRQRRLTVAVRLVLAVPHLVVVTVLGIAAYLVRVVGWISALILGRLPLWCDGFLRGYLAYVVRVNGYLWFLVDRYPPLSWNGNDYPIAVEFAAATRLNRWAVLFRSVLALPVVILTVFLNAGWTVCAVFFWIIVLVLGRVPAPIFESSAAILRVNLRTQAYYCLLTPAYVKGVFGDPAASHVDRRACLDERDNPTHPLVMSAAGRALMIVLLVVGVVGYIAQILVRATVDQPRQQLSTTAQDDVVDTIRAYYTAVDNNDGRLACALLSPITAQSLQTAAGVDSCPAAIDTTVRVLGRTKTHDLASFRYDARQVTLSGNDTRASIRVGDILALNGRSGQNSSTIELQKNTTGQWILTSLG